MDFSIFEETAPERRDRGFQKRGEVVHTEGFAFCWFLFAVLAIDKRAFRWNYVLAWIAKFYGRMHSL
ncbi:hypothetical protein [Fibrobacter intestinalis]|uniref:Uncharacterized protein n=1 Tax=Fibrobacter intestinalis TaxID=28122 RepID=A0A1T4L8G7_9BACT|nr:MULTISPECIES: hypothetical protein [Fibrobacter]SJZ50933.1 hypothetical protein SAMN02745108_00799 [Fibrobacter intestinalis]